MLSGTVKVGGYFFLQKDSGAKVPRLPDVSVPARLILAAVKVAGYFS